MSSKKNKGKSKDRVVHEIEVFTNGGKCELLSLGGETIELKPLKVKDSISIINMFGNIIPIANKNVHKFLPDGWTPTGDDKLDNLIRMEAAGQAQKQALMCPESLDKIIMFICDIIEKPRSWVEDTIKPLGMLQILEVMVEQNELEKYIPFFKGKGKGDEKGDKS